MSHSPSYSTTSSSSSSSMAPPQPPSSTPGILHHVHPVSAFEVNPSSTSTNLLLWIGGLTDTYHSVSYVYTLAASLPSSWSLAQANLSSAGSGWGIASLSQDVNEISSLVSYFRTQGKQKVVIMGHSTGCQDCLHYFASEVHNSDHREIVDGAILQASVSDREAIAMDMDPSELESTNTTAKDWCSNGKGEHILPLSLTASNFGHNPVSARRWVSLACVGGEDDYFSSDLPDSTLEKTFGRVDKPLLILYGEEDEYVPKSVDRKKLVNRWIPFVKGRVDEQSRELLGGASHNLNGDDQEVVDELVKRVGRFLSSI